MISGIYFVEFRASTRNVGAGLVIIDDGVVNGGDATYLYRGRFDHYAGSLRASIEVSHYRGEVNAVMGPFREFTLNLSGSADERQFVLSGGSPTIPGVTIELIGRKVANLFGQ